MWSEGNFEVFYKAGAMVISILYRTGDRLGCEMFSAFMNSDGRRFELSRKIILTIIAVALVMVVHPVMAVPSPPNVVINFVVTNPNFSITSELAGQGGVNSTDAVVEFALSGTGQTYGTFEGRTDSQTRWTSLYGTYYASEGNFSSSFKASAFRTNSSDLNSTFINSQGVNATGVGPLEFTAAGQLLTGLYVYGETGVCSVGDTWALGVGQELEATGQSVTVPAENRFEQRDSAGSLVGDAVVNQFDVTAAGGDRFTGVGEGGSYDGSAFGLADQPGFGFGSCTFSLGVRDSTGTISADNQTFTDHIVGETSIWCNYPGYPSP